MQRGDTRGAKGAVLAKGKGLKEKDQLSRDKDTKGRKRPREDEEEDAPNAKRARKEMEETKKATKDLKQGKRKEKESEVEAEKPTRRRSDSGEKDKRRSEKLRRPSKGNEKEKEKEKETEKEREKNMKESEYKEKETEKARSATTSKKRKRSEVEESAAEENEGNVEGMEEKEEERAEKIARKDINWEALSALVTLSPPPRNFAELLARLPALEWGFSAAPWPAPPPSVSAPPSPALLRGVTVMVSTLRPTLHPHRPLNNLYRVVSELVPLLGGTLKTRPPTPPSVSEDEEEDEGRTCDAEDGLVVLLAAAPLNSVHPHHLNYALSSFFNLVRSPLVQVPHLI